jgi:hypothetical protein
MYSSYIPSMKGGPEGIRTLGHLVKSQMLYLAELQAQIWGPQIPLIIYTRRYNE